MSTNHEASTNSVIAAVFGNGIIAILKIIAFMVSGSGAMLAESIHSIADTMNQALLWFGIKRSQQPPTELFPFGFGAERYFWALVSAMGIFVLGCGVTIYHGVHQLLHPEPAEIGLTTAIVLIISVLVEGSVFVMALKEVLAKKGEQSIWAYLKGSSDPTLIAVLLEDAIAVSGIFIAALGIYLSKVTGILAFDGIASIIIGLMLGVLAIVLALKNRSLLIGRSATPEMQEKILKLVTEDSAVAKVISLRTRVLAANEHRLDLQVDFDPDAIITRLMPTVISKRPNNDEEMDQIIRKFGHQLIDDLALEVDRLEAKIRKEIPAVSLIDIEGD